MATTSTPATMKTLGARRRRAEAEIQAVDAQRAARLATAEAEHAERQAAQQQALARSAELAAQLDELDAWAKQRRQDELDQVRRDVERRADLMEQVRAFINEKPMPVPMSREEREQFWAREDREAARREQAEQDRLRKEMDACESRRLWDYKYRQSFDRRHAREGCDCPGHRAWRREQP